MTPSIGRLPFDDDHALFRDSVRCGGGAAMGITADDILGYGSATQTQCWLPRMISGETITATSMTEPGTGPEIMKEVIARSICATV